MSTKKQLGYSPLTKRIVLARMKDMGNGCKMRVGSEEENVTNEAAQMVAQLVIDEGGEISWDLGDEILRVTAERVKKTPKQEQK